MELYDQAKAQAEFVAVIVLDVLSAETNRRTEFVAVLSNQPQGGFITRKPSTESLIARDDDGRDDDGFGFFFERNGTQGVAIRVSSDRRSYQPRDRGWPGGKTADKRVGLMVAQVTR